jgi:hypothetical protein
VPTQLWRTGTNSSVKHLGRAYIPLLDVCNYLKVISVYENWLFPLLGILNTNGRLDTKPREKSGRVSLEPEDIHGRPFV